MPALLYTKIRNRRELLDELINGDGVIICGDVIAYKKLDDIIVYENKK
jgi:hypothetical protein